MILSIPMEIFTLDNIHFLDAKKNVNMNGIFSKMHYSIESFFLNGVYITYSLQRFKNENNTILQKLHQIECAILDKYKSNRQIHKNNTLVLLPNLMTQSKNVELCDENTWFANHQTNIIKISGIWETEHAVGITYRIIHT